MKNKSVSKPLKVLLVAINAKYIHSNLAVHSIAAYGRKKFGLQVDIEVCEYTINQPIGKIMTDIYEKHAEIVMFSCYIWNIAYIDSIVSNLAKVSPSTHIWLGGPEVSFDGEERISTEQVRGIICGEGEEAVCRVISKYLKEENPEGIVIEENILNMDFLPFTYESLDEFDNKIIYYESSRGCPFRCSYCLSSVDKVLRYRSLSLVKQELEIFLDRKVPQVKFVDRTFNCDKERTKEIWTFLSEKDNGVTNFHFEVAGDILDDELIEILNTLRPGQIQLEIGVQSTNEMTLKEINRPMSFEKLSEVVHRIKATGNVHLHLDLIAGLPYEDMESFKNSFNEVFSLRPHQLQLGFLKVLKGSPMAYKCEEYGLLYTEDPPYEVLATKWISFEELIMLKRVEEMVEVYYNSGQFNNSVEFLLDYVKSPFNLFEDLALWYEENYLEIVNFSRNSRYENILKFGESLIGDNYGNETLEDFKTQLIMDYYLRENAKTRPVFFRANSVEKEFSKEFYSVCAREHKYLSEGEYDTDDPRKLRNMTHIEKVGDKYYLFDYANRNPMDNNARVIEICL